MEKDFNGYIPPFMDYNYNMPPFGSPQEINDPMLNPIMQYEQAYSYYKYLCMQMDYKIKCKEYEKMCHSQNASSSERRERKIEW